MMADFCRQCSIELFTEDYEDLAGLTTEEDTIKNIFAYVVCEGCGYTYVDHKGNCVNPYCISSHGKEAE